MRFVAGRPRRPSTTTRTSPSEENDGFRSGGELRFARDLKARGLAYRYEDPAEKIPYVIAHIYNPDFSIDRPDGTRLVVEYKGYFDQEDRRKHKAIKEANPDLDIRFVFDNPRNLTQPLRKGAKSTVRDWLDKLGIQWAVGTLPQEWLHA